MRVLEDAAKNNQGKRTTKDNRNSRKAEGEQSKSTEIRFSLEETDCNEGGRLAILKHKVGLFGR